MRCLACNAALTDSTNSRGRRKREIVVEILAEAVVAAGRETRSVPAGHGHGGHHASQPHVPQVHDPHIPPVHVPHINIPDIHIPDVHIPDVHIPDIDIPDVHVPDVHVPQVHVPTTLCCVFKWTFRLKAPLNSLRQTLHLY